LSLLTAGSTTQRLLSKKTARMGDKAKPSGVGGADGFAVCGAAFLCCASHSVASNSGPFAARLTRPFLQLALLSGVLVFTLGYLAGWRQAKRR
jgi:hypothetical protein